MSIAQTTQNYNEAQAAHKRYINLASLNIVREELVLTIEQAATQLEGFVSDRDNARSLQTCMESLRQIKGSLELIELHGAIELAAALLDTAQEINNNQTELKDDKLSALTRGLFILSCYFEYALKQEQGLPALLIPYINDIRIVNRQPILWESHFTHADTAFRVPAKPRQQPLPEGEDIASTARRLRHMYQIGLVRMIKESHPTAPPPAPLQLMERAAVKMYQRAKGSSSETFWWLLAHTLRAFGKADLSMTLERKRFFSQLDREFKQVEKAGSRAFDQSINEACLKELAYYVTLSGLDENPYHSIKTAFGYANLGYTESRRLNEAKALTGPSASAVSSVAETLKIELRTIKEVMQFVYESDSSAIDSLDELIGNTTRIHDILNMVGLKTAGQVMQQQVDRLNTLRATDKQLDALELSEIADAFVYVESVLDSVEKLNFSDEKLAGLNRLPHRQVIINSQLADAQLLVLEEAESGLAMVKRSLSAFAESSCDRGHIKNITTALNSIRGSMVVLELNRAAAVVSGCIQFVDKSLLADKPLESSEHMLETFADALICLEYYLDCIKVGQYTSDDTLIIAEESLAALGHKIAS